MNTKFLLAVLSLGLLMLGTVAWYKLSYLKIIMNPTHQACVEESKRCSDGSYVTRVAPDCAFAPCATVISTTTATSTTHRDQAKETGTLQGTVTIGPICPVERVGHPCLPTAEMYALHKVFVYSVDNKKLIITLTPDSSGAFVTKLPVGNYLVDTAHQTIGSVRGVPQTVQIFKGQIVIVSINIDTGIR